MSSTETYHFVYFKECDVELWTKLQKEFFSFQFKEEFYFLYSIEQNDKRLELHVYNNRNNGSHLAPIIRHAYKITSIKEENDDFKALELLTYINKTQIEIWEKIDPDNFPVIYSYNSECRRSIYSYTRDDTNVEFVYDISKNTLSEKYYIRFKTRKPQII